MKIIKINKKGGEWWCFTVGREVGEDGGGSVASYEREKGRVRVVRWVWGETNGGDESGVSRSTK